MTDAPSVGSPNVPMHIDGEAVQAVQSGEEVKQTAFLCFIEADYNISRAHRLLTARLAMEGQRAPDRSTISRWASSDQWKVKADEIVHRDYPLIRRRHVARLVNLEDQAIGILAALFAGELNEEEPVVLKAKVDVVKALLPYIFGVPGSKANPNEILPPPPPTVEVEAMSPAERAERQRRRLEEQHGR